MFDIRNKSGTLCTYDGDLNLSGTTIESLPDNMLVRGNLLLDGCRFLKCLPHNLKVLGGISAEIDCNAEVMIFNGCTSLVKLPEGLTTHTLELVGCTSLVTLPNEMSVSYSIALNECISLRRLPKTKFRDEINVHMWGCISLLNDIPNAVYNDVSLANDAICGFVDPQILDWCSENNITLTEVYRNDTKPYPIKCLTIDDPAQLMHYRLRWS